MQSPTTINFFDLSDSILEKLNCQGKFCLTHYDFSLRLRRDTNYPSKRFCIDFVLFQQEVATTYYCNTYDTIEKIVQLLFVHWLQDGGYHTIEDAVLLTKQYSLTVNLQTTMTEAITLLATAGYRNATAFVDIQASTEGTDEKGLPHFELNFAVENYPHLISILLPSNATDFDKKSLLTLLQEQLVAYTDFLPTNTTTNKQ